MELKLLIVSMVFLLWTRYLISAETQKICHVPMQCDDGPAWINLTTWNQEQLTKVFNKKFSNDIKQMTADVITLNERLARFQQNRQDRQIDNQTTVRTPATSNTENQKNCFVAVMCEQGQAWINFTAWNEKQLTKSVNKKFFNVIKQMKADVVSLSERLTRLQQTRQALQIANQTTVRTPSTSDTVTTTSITDTFRTEVPSSATLLSSPAMTGATENLGANPSSTTVFSSSSQTRTTEKPEEKAQVPVADNCTQICERALADGSKIIPSQPNDFSPNGTFTATIIDGGPKQVQCNCMNGTRHGMLSTNGWVVIQRRVDADANFSRSWSEYVNGFSDRGNFWIGLQILNQMTRTQRNGAFLQIESGKRENQTMKFDYIRYRRFYVSSQTRNFSLAVELDSMKNSTYDALDSENEMPMFSMDGSSGWWFTGNSTNLNGKSGILWGNVTYDIAQMLILPESDDVENCTYATCTRISSTSHTLCINENCKCDRSWLLKLMPDNKYSPDWDKTCKVSLGVSCSEVCQHWSDMKTITYAIKKIAYIKIDGQYEKVYCICSSNNTGWMVVWREGRGDLPNITDYNKTFEDENGYYWIGFSLIGRLSDQYNASLLMIMRKRNNIMKYGFLSKKKEMSDVDLCFGFKCESLRSLIMNSSVDQYDVIKIKIMTPEAIDSMMTSSCDGAAKSGVMETYRNGAMYEVYCDMVTDGGRWTVFQRRMDGTVDFYRDWEDYARGFGHKSGEFWLGLEAVHQLTQDGAYELRVDLTDWDGRTGYAKYGTFSISGRSDNYRLTVGEYSGTAGDSLAYNNNRPFSAKNKDLDSCATSYQAAWWFGGCSLSNLNGRYNDTKGSKRGVWWYDWKKRNSLKASEMKFRKK